jgi:hypothetical protein
MALGTAVAAMRLPMSAASWNSCCIGGGGVVMRDAVVSDESIDDGCGESLAKPPDGCPEKPKPREAALTSMP